MQTTALLDGIRLQQAGHSEAARTVFAALGDDPQAAYLTGLSYLRDGDAACALPPLRRAATSLPMHDGVRINLARAAIAAELPEEAAAAAAQVLASDTPQAEAAHAEAALLLGTALSALGRPAEAEGALRQAVRLAPDHAASHLNLGNTLIDLDRLDEAEACIRIALEHNPALVEASASLGHLLTVQGRLDEAVAACERAIALRPDFARAHWNQGIALLLAGDWERGWTKYEWRKRHDQFGRCFRPMATQQWTGGTLAGRTLLVLAEQGLGDAIMLARYLPLLAAPGARVVLACDRSLHKLLAPLADEVTDREGALPPHDFWIDMMSLPGLFYTRPDNVPAGRGYLDRPSGPSTTGRRVGIVWAGNGAHHNDRRRSLPPDALPALIAAAGGAPISLQQGPRAADGAAFGLHTQPVADMADTARLLATLDLLIAVDTSVAHLAGAMGVPCRIMLPHAPDWRWMLGRDDTSWYSSVRLFRQPSPGDWRAVIERIAVAREWS